MYEPNDQENAAAKLIVDLALKVHTKLGPGLLEKAYEEYLFYLIVKEGISVEKQKILPIKVDEIEIESGFRIDLLVDDCLIVELKSVESIAPVHHAQMHTYLKLSGKRLGLILNFNVPSMRDGIKRIVMSK